MFLTLSVNIKNKKILFIGSGRIAEHKIKNVINYEPSICVIGIEATDYILNLNKNNMISYYKKEFNDDDIENDYFMVFAATSNRELNKNISILCKNKNILCDNVSDHNYSDVITPVNIKIDCIDISINTNGENPELTKELKKDINCYYLLGNLYIKTDNKNALNDIVNYLLINDSKKPNEKLSKYLYFEGKYSMAIEYSDKLDRGNRILADSYYYSGNYGRALEIYKNI